MHLVAQFLDFGVVSGHIHSSRLSAGAGLSGRGLVFAPAPEPRDGRAARARGARGSLRRTLVARPALAVAISAPSLLTRRWAKAARTENASQKQRRSAGQTPPTCAGDFLSQRDWAPFPVIAGGPDLTGTHPGHRGLIGK